MSFRLIAKSVWLNPGNRGQRIRRTLAALRWQVYKRTFRRPRLLRLPNGLLFNAYPDCVVSSALIYAEWPEYLELLFLRKHLDKDVSIIDIGANVGHFSLLLADRVRPENILAFEPTPLTYKRLCENWSRNHFATDLLMQAAVGSRAGTVWIPDVDRPVTTNTIAPDARHGAVGVPLVCLDDWADRWKWKPVGLLKIDVEGFEPRVFAGANRFLKEVRPQLIMFESLHGRLDPAIRTVLRDNRYEVFELDEGGQPSFDRVAAQNLFAVPAELRSHLI